MSVVVITDGFLRRSAYIHGGTLERFGIWVHGCELKINMNLSLLEDFIFHIAEKPFLIIAMAGVLPKFYAIETDEFGIIRLSLTQIEDALKANRLWISRKPWTKISHVKG